MSPARAWLPNGATRDGLLREAVGRIVADWARVWFADDKLVETKQANPVHTPPITRSALVNNDHSLMLVFEPASELDLASAMLAAPIGWPKPRAGDEAIARELAHCALRDLLGAVARLGLQAREQTFEIKERTIPPEDHVRFSFARAGVGIDLYIGAEAAILARRGAFQSDRALAHGALKNAIDRQSVTTAIMLGKREVRLSDVSNIAEGDVLVLDRGPDDEVFFSINAQILADFAGAIERRDGGLHLRLTKTPTDELK